MKRSRTRSRPGEAPAPARAAALKRQALAAGDSAGRETIGRLVRDLDAQRTERALRSALPHLREAIVELRAERYDAAAEAARRGVAVDPASSHGWHLLGIACEKLAGLSEALDAFERALALDPSNLDIVNNLARLAYRLKMLPQARTLFEHFLAQRPDSEDAINNLACVLRDQLDFEAAIGLLQPAIAARPQSAPLWNTLGTVLSERGDMDQAALFLDEALRHDPSHGKALCNRATVRLALGDAAGAAIDCEAALPCADSPEDRAMMRFARATMLLASGDLSRGWEAYESRFDRGYLDPPHFLVERPRWAPGDDLAGRHLMAFGEQGLGDEVLFANLLPDLLQALGPDGRLSLAVERRLVPLFRRAFPRVAVNAHLTTRRYGRIMRGAPFIDDWADVDLWSPLGSLLRGFRADLAAFPTARPAFLAADPDRVAHWRGQLDGALPAGPKIGLLWTSALITASRHRYFAPFAAWEPVLRAPGAVFVNLQYGDCAAEIGHARDRWGVEVWSPPGIDLKHDLDDVAALSCALDLVIGPANATSNIAAACGAPIWLISTPGAWPRLGTEHYPWYPQARVFLPPAFGDWSPVMEQVAQALAELASEREIADPGGTGRVAEG